MFETLTGLIAPKPAPRPKLPPVVPQLSEIDKAMAALELFGFGTKQEAKPAAQSLETKRRALKEHITHEIGYLDKNFQELAKAMESVKTGFATLRTETAGKTPNADKFQTVNGKYVLLCGPAMESISKIPAFTQAVQSYLTHPIDTNEAKTQSGHFAKSYAMPLEDYTYERLYDEHELYSQDGVPFHKAGYSADFATHFLSEASTITHNMQAFLLLEHPMKAFGERIIAQSETETSSSWLYGVRDHYEEMARVTDGNDVPFYVVTSLLHYALHIAKNCYE